MNIADGYAWPGERGLYIVTNLLSGKVLLYSDQALEQLLGGQMEQLTAQIESYQAIAGSMEKYAAIAYEWMTGMEGLVTVSENSVPGAETRDPAAASVELRVTPEQLKALLVTLAEEFSTDEALQQLVAASVNFTDGSTVEDVGEELLAAARALSHGAASALIAQTGDFSAHVDFSSDTRLVGEEDFACDSEIGLAFMGIRLGTARVRITSETDFFMNTSDMELIEMAQLDGAGTEALDKALEDGFNAAVIRLVSVLPPELLAMMQGE